MYQVVLLLQDKRVFLAGDAAHRFPPAGAFGMNTGIQVCSAIHACLFGWLLTSVVVLSTFDSFELLCEMHI